ncbi:MAG: MFS transporter [Alphaproteobacteria bacterium]|nr:MFS transporter [Alphaproteobacteria bacterium]
MTSKAISIEDYPGATGTRDISKSYRYWRLRIMYSMMMGYAGFYLIRQNFTMAIPSMQSELGYSKTQIGWIITSAAIVYGLGKGLSGLLSDRSNARYFMTFGLFMSAVMNLCMGFSSTLPSLMIFWTLNSCFQSMGWPPCARLLTHWFCPKEIGTKWALWNTSQQIGGAAILVMAGFLIENYGWRYAFYVPGIICLFLSVFLFNRLRDTPQSLGLPSVEEYKGLVKTAQDHEEQNLTMREIIVEKVLKNKLVWYVCFANFFLYIVRMAVFNWAPTFLREFKGSPIETAGWQSATFDVAGMFGGVVAGYLSDKIFRGHRGQVGSIFMVLLAFCVLFLWNAPAGQVWLHFIGMATIGFLVSGPQILVGVAATDFASKKAAGAASGLTGIFGYLGTAVTGVGVGAIVDNYGWDYAFMLVTASALLGAVFFSLTWNHRSKVLEELDKANLE